MRLNLLANATASAGGVGLAETVAPLVTVNLPSGATDALRIYDLR